MFSHSPIFNFFKKHDQFYIKAYISPTLMHYDSI